MAPSVGTRSCRWTIASTRSIFPASLPSASWDQPAAGSQRRQGRQCKFKSYPIGYFQAAPVKQAKQPPAYRRRSPGSSRSEEAKCRCASQKAEKNDVVTLSTKIGMKVLALRSAINSKSTNPIATAAAHGVATYIGRGGCWSIASRSQRQRSLYFTSLVAASRAPKAKITPRGLRSKYHQFIDPEKSLTAAGPDASPRSDWRGREIRTDSCLGTRVLRPA